MDLTQYPTVALYALLALTTAGVGVGVLIYQTGATQHALRMRRGMLAGGVLLVLLGGVVLVTQLYAVVVDSYATIGTSAG